MRGPWLPAKAGAQKLFNTSAQEPYFAGAAHGGWGCGGWGYRSACFGGWSCGGHSFPLRADAPLLIVDYPPVRRKLTLPLVTSYSAVEQHHSSPTSSPAPSSAAEIFSSAPHVHVARPVSWKRHAHSQLCFSFSEFPLGNRYDFHKYLAEMLLEICKNPF